MSTSSVFTKFELYYKITQLAGLGVWERNLRTGEVHWNTLMNDIYDVEPGFSATIDQMIEFYVDKHWMRKLIHDTIRSGLPKTKEAQLVTAKGNQKWVKLRIYAEMEMDKCIRIYGTLEDITGYINLLQRSSEREKQFHHAFEYAPIGMALVSPNGNWLRVNKTLCHMLGYTKQELLKFTFQDITHPEDLDIDLEQMYRLLGGQISTYHLDKRYYHKEGHIIWASLNVSLILDHQGEPLYFVSQIKDISDQKQQEMRLMAEISDRKRIEMELTKTMNIIRAQNERLFNFAHIVSHNLRSHIGNIQMITNMIGEETDDAEKGKLLDMLNINAANLQETLLHLNDVVDVQINPKQQLSRIIFADEIIKVTKTLAGSLKQAEANLIMDIDPAIEIETNRAYMESVLLNLLTNAIKYRDKHRALKLSIKAQKRDGLLILKVKDNGTGIDLRLHGQKLFGMHKTFHGNEDARGIGLFLVKSQVEAMGGVITVKSTPDKGTTFRIEWNL
jgi:PAS domain S-box-containing protein